MKAAWERHTSSLKRFNVTLPDFVIAMTHNLLWFLLVHASQLRSCFLMDAKQFVQLRMKRKSIPAICSLNEERHYPYGQGGHSVPIKPRSIKDNPKDSVDNNDYESCWVPSCLADFRCPMAFCIHD